MGLAIWQAEGNFSVACLWFGIGFVDLIANQAADDRTADRCYSATTVTFATMTVVTAVIVTSITATMIAPMGTTFNGVTSLSGIGG